MRLFAMTSILMLAAAAHAGSPAQPTAVLYADVLLPDEQLPLITTPPLDLERIAAEDAEREAAGQPPHFAVPHVVEIDPARDGRWEDVVDGIQVWRLRIASPGAVSLNLGFLRYRMPEGGRLMLYTPDLAQVVRPFTAADNAEHGQLWTPVIPGDEIVVEVSLPAHATQELELLLGAINVGYRGFLGDGDAGGTYESGSCNNDVVCPEGDPWQNEIKSVGWYTLNGIGTCSGAMINNTSQDRTPYFLTADHCGVSSGNAASMVVYWNYETSTCQGPPDGVLTDFQNGATFRSDYGPSDMTLVELTQDPDPAWEVTFAGWDRSGVDPPAAVAIHHPALDEKRISFEDDALNTTSYLSNPVPGDSTHFRVIDWDDGTTEPGSSGSPLFDPAHRIIGQLHGGYASCTSQTSDWYGKLSRSWTGGGSSSSRLSDWLDPGGTGATTVDTLFEPVPALISITQQVDDSAGGDNDGNADPGETIVLIIDVTNAGTVGATSISGVLSTTTPGVTILDNQAGWPNLAPQQTASSFAPHFTVQISSGFTCGGTIDLSLQLTANEEPGVWPLSFSLGTGTALIETVFTDDMESGANGWATQTPTGSNSWSQTTSRSLSPTHSWWVDDIDSVADSMLISPTQNALAANASLRFAHYLSSESTYDGGVLEYSTNGGGSWLDAGSLITQGGYNSTISTQYSSPIGGRQAWSGDLGGWQSVEVDLSSLVGENVQLRWRFATDSSVTADGWYIDDVEFEATEFLCAPLVAPGEASEPFTASPPFRIEPRPLGLFLSWGAPVTGGPIDDYVLYSMPIGSPSTPPTCQRDFGSNTSAQVLALPNNIMMLVVARNAAGEGSYGKDSEGTERGSAGAGVCP